MAWEDGRGKTWKNATTVEGRLPESSVLGGVATMDDPGTAEEARASERTLTVRDCREFPTQQQRSRRARG